MLSIRFTAFQPEDGVTEQYYCRAPKTVLRVLIVKRHVAKLALEVAMHLADGVSHGRLLREIAFWP